MYIRLESLIDKNYKTLNSSDKHIWRYILNNKKACENMSIQELALKCNVSHTTVLRFTQKIGLNGYSELKFYLKLENNEKCVFDKKEINNVKDDINRTVVNVINGDFSELFSLIDNCERIYAYGSGEIQNNAVRELKRSLLSIGKLVHIIDGNDELETTKNYMTDKDMIFLVSLSGENEYVNSFVDVFHNKRVKVASITQNGNNTLSKISDISVQFYTHEVVKLEDNIHIILGSQFFIIIELLLIKYIEYKYSKKSQTDSVK